MKPEIKAQWIEALRSGEYTQIDGQLRLGNDVCCLGVLCDLAAKQGLGVWLNNEFLTLSNGEVMGADRSVPPIGVAKWAGLYDPNPLIDAERDLRLALYNDGSVDFDIPAHTFAEIADLIEAHL